MKPPDTYGLIGSIQKGVLNNLQKFPSLARFKEVLDREVKILKILKKIQKNAFVTTILNMGGIFCGIKKDYG